MYEYWNLKLKLRNNYFILAGLWLIPLIIGSILVRMGFWESCNSVQVLQIYQKSSWNHLLGTDSLGRDLLYRIILGSSNSLLISFLSLFVSLILALLYGGSSGWFGKRIDLILMLGLDVWMSIPTSALGSILALIFVKQSDSLFVLSLIIGFTNWGRLARLIRGEVYRLREKSFLKAAESIGASELQILIRHLIPHLRPITLVYLVHQIPTFIFAESFLSFIGLGVQAPETSWGILIQEGWRSLLIYPHIVLFPAVFLFLTVLSINLLVIKKVRR